MHNDLLIKGGRLLSIDDGYNYDKKDILIKNGKIEKISDSIEFQDGYDVINLNGEIVSPGFIDVHGHLDIDNPMHIGIHPDVVGVRVGNSAIVDAGSTGVENFENFREKCIKHSLTKVYALLNLSCKGLDTFSELSDSSRFKIDEMRDMINKYPNEIIGIKVRSDGEATQTLGIYPFELGHKLAHDMNVPFVVHVGEYPPKINDMLKVITKGDLLTHCYNQYAPNGIYNSLVDENGVVLPEVFEAKKRGALFDVGHGGCSFSFDIARKAFSQGFYPDVISTDIYAWNFLSPVWSLAHTVNKIMHVGLSIEKCIKCITSTPADFFHLEHQGHLRENYCGDITIFHIENRNIELVDSKGVKEVCPQEIVVDYVVVDGKAMNVSL